jgi:protein TonB
LSAPGQPIRRPPPDVLERRPLATLAALLIVSAGIHFAVLRAAGRRGLPNHLQPAPQSLRVAVVDKPLPPPEAPTPPIPPAPRPTSRPPPIPPSPSPEPPDPAEPPPAEEAPSPQQPPELVPGLALSATSQAGSFAVPTGNTLAGRPRTGPAPAGAAPGEGGAPAPAYALTEQPVFLDNVSAAEMRRYYPEQARKARIEGVVRTRLTLAADGRVVKVAVIEDPGDGFGQAAAKLARLYRFRPARIDGRPVATEIDFTIRFQLD